MDSVKIKSTTLEELEQGSSLNPYRAMTCLVAGYGKRSSYALRTKEVIRATRYDWDVDHAI